jgi:hypothetical protein
MIAIVYRNAYGATQYPLVWQRLGPKRVDFKIGDETIVASGPGVFLQDMLAAQKAEKEGG